MNSIIICSRNEDISEDLRKNIKDTFGGIEDVDYEIIVIDNSKRQYNICSAYNEGIYRSRGDILTFIHEDVIFHTQGWGDILKIKLEDRRIGLLGIAGTHYFPHAPSSWWDPEIYSQNLIQGFESGEKYYTTLNVENRCEDGTNRLVSADGCFMCFPRHIFTSIKWDDDTFKKFHGYDTDISLQVLKSGYEIQLIWKILIEHKSIGDVWSKDFIESKDLLFNKWKEFLPQIRGVYLSQREIEVREHLAMQIRKTAEIRFSREYKIGDTILRSLKLPCCLFRHVKSSLLWLIHLFQ